MAGYWLKLYTEILEDPKYYRLSDNAKLGMYELMLVAKRIGNDGDLPPINDIEFYTRRPASWWIPVIEELESINFITENGSGDKIRKFEDRQRAIPDNERQKNYRKALHDNEFSGNEPVTELSRNVTESKSKSKSREEVDTDADVRGGSIKLLSTFVEIYPGLKPRNHDDLLKWEDSYDRMAAAGVTPAIMRRAARELADKQMKVASPGSLVNPCLMVMQKDPPRKSNSEGAFKDAVIT